MKMGFAMFRGTELKVRKEFEELKVKAKEGFKDGDVEVVEDGDSFTIITEDIQINFQVSHLNPPEFAIFQIID